MLTDETIRRIASEESHHVCESGAPNAKQHNARVVEQAIRRAIAGGELALSDEQNAHDSIASICFKVGAESSNGTSVSAVKSLAAMVEELKLDKKRLDYLQAHCLVKSPADTYLKMEFDSGQSLRRAIDNNFPKPIRKGPQ